MKIAIFAKTRNTSDGRTFTAYTAKLRRKSTGDDFTVSVKFRESCGAPEKDACPCMVETDRKACNLATRTYTDAETGEVKESYTLWVTAWTPAGAYVDTSMDDIAE